MPRHKLKGHRRNSKFSQDSLIKGRADLGAFVSLISTSWKEELRYSLNNVNLTSVSWAFIFPLSYCLFFVCSLFCSMLSSCSSWQWKFSRLYFIVAASSKCFLPNKSGQMEAVGFREAFLVSTPSERCQVLWNADKRFPQQVISMILFCLSRRFINSLDYKP